VCKRCFLAEKQHAVLPVHFSPRRDRTRRAPPSPRTIRGYHHQPQLCGGGAARCAPLRCVELLPALVPHPPGPFVGYVLLHARASTLCRSSPASVRFSRSGCCREPLGRAAFPVTMSVPASSLSQSRGPAYLMVTADSNRSSRLLLLLTVR
jgi:hypothetical protein